MSVGGQPVHCQSRRSKGLNPLLWQALGVAWGKWKAQPPHLTLWAPSSKEIWSPPTEITNLKKVDQKPYKNSRFR